MVRFDDFKIDLSGYLALARKTGKMEFDGSFLFDGILRYVQWNYRHFHFGGKDEILQIATKNALDTFAKVGDPEKTTPERFMSEIAKYVSLIVPEDVLTYEKD